MKDLTSTMKKISFLLLTILLLTACGQVKSEPANEKSKTETKTEKVISLEPGKTTLDYPIVTTTAQPGDYVLAASKSAFDEAIKNNDDSPILTFHPAKVLVAGEAESALEDLTGKKFSMPNSLIIPIKKADLVKKGDIVLTWLQSSSGLIERALVLEEGENPKVRYLDEMYDYEENLLANSFHKLTGELEPGIGVATKDGGRYYEGTVINIAGDKALISEFAGALRVEDTANLKVLPLKFDFKVGDTVMAPVIGAFQKVTVKEIKKEIGQIMGEYEFAGSKSVEPFVLGKITKEELK